MYEEENTEPEFLKRTKKNPFKTPENYFDSIEERIMHSIKKEEKEKTSTGAGKVYRLLKPVLGLAASLALVFMLVYYPFKYFSSGKLAQTNATDTTVGEGNDFYSVVISSIDENALVNALASEEQISQEEMNPDEVIAYLSSDMNDIEIYSEIQK